MLTDAWQIISKHYIDIKQNVLLCIASTALLLSMENKYHVVLAQML